jgi:hypothetical protein
VTAPDLFRIAQEYEPAVPVAQLREHPDNKRRGDEVAISASMEAHGFYGACYVQRSTGYIVAGNHRSRVARRRGAATVPVIWLDIDDDQARRILLFDNKSADDATYDFDGLAQLLVEMSAGPGGLADTGYTDDGLAELLEQLGGTPGAPGPTSPTLAERFVFPPFTVLDARAGPWSERKRRWLSLGIRSELGRAEATTLGSRAAHVPDYYDQKDRVEGLLGRPVERTEFEAGYLELPQGSSINAGGTSVFDPVLCELAYRWFSPPGARVLDPLAGGSVRGVVAAVLGRQYTGIDLSAAQVAANVDQWQAIGGAANLATAPTLGPPARQAAAGAPRCDPRWIVGDSGRLLANDGPLGDSRYDLLFSCPPYADLEVYSDDPADLSNMPYDQFLHAYRDIVSQSVARLTPDRFAVWVVGEVRDKRSGHYRGFVADTIRAFADAGAAFHNEAVYVTPIGALRTTSARIFTASRRLTKVHQTVLVFVKGDPKRAAQACGPLSEADLAPDD